MVKITASITLNGDDNSRESNISAVMRTISKNFGRNELTNIHNVDEFICFDVSHALAIPLLISLFSTLQFYVNGNCVDMSVLK